MRPKNPNEISLCLIITCLLFLLVIAIPVQAKDMKASGSETLKAKISSDTNQQKRFLGKATYYANRYYEEEWTEGAPTPTPGGGTVSAFVGALAATLPAMVAGLTLGKKKYAAHEEAMTEVRRRAAGLRGRLLGLARRDSEAFEAVLRARKMPQATPAETEARAKAMAAADVQAMRVPLETAQACLEVLELAVEVAAKGNVNAASDSGVAGLLAHAAAEGALLNVEINLKSAANSADKTDIEMGLQRVRTMLGPLARRCQDAVHAALSA
mgnify:CR=1 FL=1